MEAHKQEEKFEKEEKVDKEVDKEVNKESDAEEAEYAESTRKKEIAVPGDVLASGSNFLPGEGTIREGNDIISTRYGLVYEEGRLVRIIPLSGVYIPRVGNIVIGEIVDIMFNGWQIDIKSPYMSFLPISECRGFINKRDDLSSYFDFGDMIVAKIIGVKSRGIDLTMRDRGLRKLQGGIIIYVNPNKVPRIIGKKGSMINIIKDKTGCDITVGQNGIIWIKGDTVNHELLAKEAINLIVGKSFVDGLTEQVEEYLSKNSKGLKIVKREEVIEEPYEREEHFDREERFDREGGFNRGGGGFNRGRGGFRGGGDRHERGGYGRRDR
jgi:exosome complex component RRP4